MLGTSSCVHHCRHLWSLAFCHLATSYGYVIGSGSSLWEDKASWAVVATLVVDIPCAAALASAPDVEVHVDAEHHVVASHQDRALLAPEEDSQDTLEQAVPAYHCVLGLDLDLGHQYVEVTVPVDQAWEEATLEQFAGSPSS